MTPGDTLRALAATLHQIEDLLPPTIQHWNDSPLVRLAVERLWIFAGNLAQDYAEIAGLPGGLRPWSELAGYRHVLAHALPGEIIPERVFARH